MILETRNITKSYSNRRVVDGISVKVSKGRITGLLGPNGAGKTTTFYSIAGFIRPDSGQIVLNNKDITPLPVYKRAAKGISYLAQEPSIFRKLTVEENVRIILEPLGIREKVIKQRTGKLMEELKLEHLATNKGYGLSGGERRRVEIMRALAINPDFILLDEPFAGIDPLAVADLQQIIRDLRHKGLGILISDHNVRETLSVCDHAYIVNNGRILSEGNAEAIIQCDAARKMYLGNDFMM